MCNFRGTNKCPTRPSFKHRILTSISLQLTQVFDDFNEPHSFTAPPSSTFKLLSISVVYLQSWRKPVDTILWLSLLCCTYFYIGLPYWQNWVYVFSSKYHLNCGRFPYFRWSFLKICVDRHITLQHSGGDLFSSPVFSRLMSRRIQKE